MAGLNSLVLFTADPWESAMPVLRVIDPARRAGIRVLCGYDRVQVFPERIAEADLVVIQRDFPRITGFEGVAAEAKRLQKPIVYEIDDLLFEIPDTNIHYVTYLDALLRMMRAARLADAAITSTPILKEYVGQINPNTWLIPNYLDDALWPIATDHAQAALGDPVVIGYMGGHTHLADLETIADALSQVLEKYGSQVKLRFWGGPPPEKLRNRPEVEYIPIDILDYAQFAAYFSTQTCDIFIAPLKNDGFNQYKSHIKYLEYSSFGIPGVYSQSETYNKIVENGVTGFLADSSSEWFQCLAKLIEAPDLRRKIGRLAQEDIKKNWLLSNHSADWLEVYERILAQFPNSDKPGTGEDVILKLLMRAQGYQNQLKDANSQKQAQLQQEHEIGKALSEKINEQEAYLQALKRTRSWRLIESLQSLRKNLLPVGGKGEALLKKTYRVVSRLLGQKK